MSDPAHVFEAGADDFARLVLAASEERPVLVDFWAPWCAPCRALAPVLLKLAEEYAGAFLLAKVNTDEQRELAMENGIRSLPTVRLYRNGQPVDEFMGALPESAVRAFLHKHLAPRPDPVLEQAEAARIAGDTDGAERLLRAALEEQPADAGIATALLAVLLEDGRHEAAGELLRGLPVSVREEPVIRRLEGRLRFASRAREASDEGALVAALERDPADLESRYRLSAVRVVQGRFEEALELLLDIVRRNRGFHDDAARRDMLDLFELMDGSGELVSRYRARLASALH